MKIYSPSVKDEVRNLRLSGLSLNEIHEVKAIPKTTIRGWIKHIKLSGEQRKKFKERTLDRLQKGRIKAQLLQKEKRLRNEKDLMQKGIQKVGKLSKRELFIAGVALYWAEGFKNKYEHRLGFCNSDPLMMKFYVRWLEACLDIKKDQLVARVTLNKSYEPKIKEIEKYWSEFLDISLSQFTKPFYQNSIWKKEFNTDIYKGVLRIHVKDSLNDLLKMKGWIEGLKMIK